LHAVSCSQYIVVLWQENHIQELTALYTALSVWNGEWHDMGETQVISHTSFLLQKYFLYILWCVKD